MMALESKDKQAVHRDPDARALRWLGAGGGVALVLAVLAVLLALQRASDERHAAEDVRGRVQAEMNRIEAEAQRIEREAAK